MDRHLLLDQVSAALGTRSLVWFGTRGEDVLSVSDLPQFSSAFSLISTLTSLPSVSATSLEDLTGRRVDLDTFDIDDVADAPEVRELREHILRTLSGPSALVEYRPTSFSSAIAFARQDRCRHLGLFTGHQAAFEHKPWVESAVAALGVPHIPWVYVADMDQLDTVRFLDDGPVVLRRSRTSGGVGLVRLDSAEDLEALWPDEPEAYVSVAPFIDGGISVNVAGVVVADEVTVHPSSVQLIGSPECTSRPFGYCGNDFGAAASFADDTLDEIEVVTKRIGALLAAYGYRGAFGVDYMLVDGRPIFTEVNPRFQGSTHASARLSVEQGRSCLLLEHLAAFLGLRCEPSEPLREQMAQLPSFAHIVTHHQGVPERVDPAALIDRCHASGSLIRADVVTRPDLVTDHGGTVCRLTVSERVVDAAGKLLPFWSSVVGRPGETLPLS